MPQKQEDENSRLTKLAERHGLNLSSDLAAIFRVTTSTIGRWRAQARHKSFEDALPGPALVLLELFEDGVETVDLRDVRAAAAIRNDPEATLHPDEENWHILPFRNKPKQPERIVLPNGRIIEVFPRWFITRIQALRSFQRHMGTKEQQRCATVIERYQTALECLGGHARRGLAHKKS